MNMTKLAERGWLPDPVIRMGIRRLCQQRIREEQMEQDKSNGKILSQRLDELAESAIALNTAEANEQHYEVPTAFYQLALGANLKYSSCFWDDETPDLTAAENKMLDLYLKRGDLRDGHSILELGCGWGSLTLWMAKKLPNAKITAVSNSSTQRQYIEAEAAKRGLHNLEVITCDVNVLSIDKRFDRVISIEMFEHMRNYRQLLHRIATWLKPEGKLFVHIFCHRQWLYPFEVKSDKNWMAKYFFTGGLMPSANTLSHFNEDMTVEQQWFLPGSHYEKTANAWLENMDNNLSEIRDIFKQAYPADQTELWIQRWRLFFMACAELFGYREGSEWQIGHYLFHKTDMS